MQAQHFRSPTTLHVSLVVYSLCQLIHQ